MSASGLAPSFLAQALAKHSGFGGFTHEHLLTQHQSHSPDEAGMGGRRSRPMRQVPATLRLSRWVKDVHGETPELCRRGEWSRLC